MDESSPDSGLKARNIQGKQVASMNEKCHRTKSFLSPTVPYRCHSYVSQGSQRENFYYCDTFMEGLRKTISINIL